MPFKDEALENLKIRAQKELEEFDDIYEDYSEKVDFETFFDNNVVDPQLKTMVMEYDSLSKTLKIQLIKNGISNGVKDIVNYNMAANAYSDFCNKRLKIDPNKKYNDSSNILFRGVPTRVFAIMPPYKDYPLVVISTAKQPPKNIDTLSEIDEKKLTKVMAGNFLIAGKSGAGKTYLLNYLLNKYYPKKERIGIIQEFSEIYPPNDFTDTICTPPRVPGQQWNDLEFLTEQSNLMRYDRILVGEIKSSEAWPFIVNCASGTKGGATIHGQSPQGALQRLRTLCLLSKPNLNESVVDSFIKDAIDYVVYVEDMRVKEITELLTANNGKFSLGTVEAN